MKRTLRQVYDPYRQCYGKQAFTEKEEAMERAGSLRRRYRGMQIQVYRCAHCGTWHMGHRR